MCCHPECANAYKISDNCSEITMNSSRILAWRRGCKIFTNCKKLFQTIRHEKIYIYILIAKIKLKSAKILNIFLHCADIIFGSYSSVKLKVLVTSENKVCTTEGKRIIYFLELKKMYKFYVFLRDLKFK